MQQNVSQLIIRREKHTNIKLYLSLLQQKRQRLTVEFDKCNVMSNTSYFSFGFLQPNIWQESAAIVPQNSDTSWHPHFSDFLTRLCFLFNCGCEFSSLPYTTLSLWLHHSTVHYLHAWFEDELALLACLPIPGGHSRCEQVDRT